METFEILSIAEFSEAQSVEDGSEVTVRKCIAFFVSLLDQAGVSRSPYVVRRRRGRPVGARGPKTAVVSGGADDHHEPIVVSQIGRAHV